MPIQGDLAQLQADLEYYRDKGFQQQVEWAVKHGQCATRAYVERLHPATGFGGHSLYTSDTTSGTANLIQKGAFKILGTSISVSIYANYWARWYNTGVYLKDRRRYQAPRGDVFNANAQAIEAYFSQAVQDYLKQIMTIRR